MDVVVRSSISVFVIMATLVFLKQPINYYRILILFLIILGSNYCFFRLNAEVNIQKIPELQVDVDLPSKGMSHPCYL